MTIVHDRAGDKGTAVLGGLGPAQIFAHQWLRAFTNVLGVSDMVYRRTDAAQHALQRGRLFRSENLVWLEPSRQLLTFGLRIVFHLTS